MLGIPSFSMGFIAGFGTGFISREIMSAGVAVMRPVTKVAVKGGMMAFEKSRETLAHFSESLEDLVAEAKSEVAHPEGTREEAEEALAQTISASSSETPKVKEKQRAHGKKERG